MDDLKGLSVMFAALKSINLLAAEHQVRFEALLTDNGPEVASRGNAAGHPMERLLGELGIKHRYTRPYRGRTNGKVERFWRTLNADLLEGTTFETVEELKEELALYLVHVQHGAPASGIGGQNAPPGPAGSVNELLDIYKNDAVPSWRSVSRRVWRAGARACRNRRRRVP